MKITKKKFTGRENHSVTILESIDFITNYRAHPTLGRNTSCYFDRRAIESLIEQPDAVGLRYYYGLTDDNRKVLVLVGADAERQDLINGEPLQLSVFNPAFDENGEYDPAQIDHGIALEDAARLTATYRDLKSPEQPKGGFFGKQALQQLLAQEDCVGVRFHFGAKADGKAVMVLAGIDKFGGDMFFGRLMELSTGCPPFCDDNNKLNTGRITVSSRLETPHTYQIV